MLRVMLATALILAAGGATTDLPEVATVTNVQEVETQTASIPEVPVSVDPFLEVDLLEDDPFTTAGQSCENECFGIDCDGQDLYFKCNPAMSCVCRSCDGVWGCWPKPGWRFP